VSDRHDTAPNQVAIAIFASRIAKVMEKSPHLTFGQLVYEAMQDELGDQPLEVAINLRRKTDEEFVQTLERYVLKG
jgi:hypothetical protein